MRIKDKIKDPPITRPDNVSEEQWEQAVILYNKAKQQGDKFPELTVAQAALETGWFKNPSGKYNYFGQKASESQEGSYKTTQEYSSNNAYTTQAKFRDYNTLEQAINDRMDKWGSKYQDADNVREALYSIWRYDPEKGTGVGYATDIQYDDKIFSILGMMGVKNQEIQLNPPVASGIQGYTPTNLTNYDVTPKNTTFAQQNTATPTPTKQVDKKDETKEKANKEDVWKQKLQQKINERNFLIELVNQGATDFIGPQRQQSTAVQQIQQSYMQDGGQIPTSPNGLYDYPDAEQVIVPTTNGRITMKNITVPVLGISQETGQQILMQPGKEYHFPETKTVLEIPQRHGK